MHVTWNITSDWNVEHMLRDKENMTRGKFHGLSGGPFLRRAGVGRGRGVGWGAGWFLDKIQTCTLYILEVQIGKKRILHNFSVQKKTFMHVQWAEKKNLFEMLSGLTVWISFPNCYDKKILNLYLRSG